MERNSKIIIIFSIILVLGILATVSYSLSYNIAVDVKLDGENVSVRTLAIPLGKDIGEMENEMIKYISKEMNNIDSDTSSMKNGISKIAESYGFTNINVKLSSQFGDDNLPMLIVVDGISMYPTLQDGEEVIIEKTNNFKVGDIVVAKDPEFGLIIKRVEIISGDRVFLGSDNNDTKTIFENGRQYQMIAVEKWTNSSNIVGVAKIFNINSI